MSEGIDKKTSGRTKTDPLLPVEEIVEAILEGYVQVDKDLRIHYMNGNAERLLRRSRADSVGAMLEEAVPDASRAHQWPQLVEAIRAQARAELALFYPNQYVWHEVKIVPTVQRRSGTLHARCDRSAVAHPAWSRTCVPSQRVRVGTGPPSRSCADQST